MWKFIRKFSPDYSDLPTMVGNINLLMRALGLNIDGSIKKPIPLPFYVIAAASILCYYYVYIISMLWFVFIKCCDVGELPAAIVFGSLGISSQIAPIKLFYMMFNSSKVQWLIKQCLYCDSLTVPDSRFSRNVSRVLRGVKKRAISFWMCIMMLVILYIHIPAFLPGRHIPGDLIVVYGLEPKYETPYFELTYAMIIVGAVYICYVISTVTVFIIIIVGYIEAQMVSLSKEITHLWQDSILNTQEFKIGNLLNIDDTFNSSQVSTNVNAEVRKRLVTIMQSHTRVITLLKNLDAFYSVPNAIAFALLGVSLIAELLGGLENTYLQIPFTFVQVGMDCYAGQKVMDASLSFERALYDCQWERFDVDNMKIVLVMLQNSQKTMHISAGGMAVLNFSCLQSIVRSVYSSYTTLRSMIK